MAQTGFTPIQIYSSSTAAAAPTAGNLANSTLGSELAINITDGKLFYKDNANAIQVIGWKTVPTTAGGTGLTSYTAGDLLFYASGTALSKLAIGASGRYLSSSGTAPQWNAPAALTKTDDTNVTLTLGGSASTALLNAASLTLGWTGTLSVARGGTGAGSITSGYFLQGNGTSAFSGSTRLYTDGTNMFSDCSYRAQVQSGATNNTAPTAITVSNKTTGSAAAGLGAALEFNYFDSGGGYAGGKIAAIAKADPFTADLVFYPRNYGYAEALRIFASGGVSIGNTTDPGAKALSVSGTAFLNTNATGLQTNRSMSFVTTGASVQCISHSTSDGNGDPYMEYGYNGTKIGSITQSGTTGVNFNTTSDYRLKNVTGPLVDSGEYIDSLEPVVGTWKSDGSVFIGFIAHQAQEVSKTNVATGEKDGEQMQSLAYANPEFIANMIAELKSLRKRVAQLEAKG